MPLVLLAEAGLFGNTTWTSNLSSPLSYGMPQLVFLYPTERSQFSRAATVSETRAPQKSTPNAYHHLPHPLKWPKLFSSMIIFRQSQVNISALARESTAGCRFRARWLYPICLVNGRSKSDLYLWKGTWLCISTVFSRVFLHIAISWAILRYLDVWTNWCNSQLRS